MEKENICDSDIEQVLVKLCEDDGSSTSSDSSCDNKRLD